MKLSFKDFMGNTKGEECWFYGKIYYELYLLDISELSCFPNSRPFYSKIDDQMRNSIINGFRGNPEDPNAVP